jgi:hypothetical protein
MTTMTATLPEATQSLIDARLDTIDRMLLGRVPRADRLGIVREVESQVHELLAAHDPETLTRDDVLDVLRRLDPPEAYLPDNQDEGTRPQGRVGVGLPREPAVASRPSRVKEGRLGGIFGLVSLGLVLLGPLVYLLAALTENEFVLIAMLSGLALVGFACAVAGLVLSIRGRRGGVMPVLGMISAPLALLAWVPGGMLLVFELLGSVVM